MSEIKCDSERLFHIPAHENLKNFALALLAQSYDLFIPKVLLSRLVHSKSVFSKPALGMDFEYPDNGLDVRSYEKLTIAPE
jgi:hypothetical protein